MVTEPVGKETEEIKTPTPEETTKSLETELETLKAESQRLRELLGDEKGFKSLQTRLNEKDRELKTLQDLNSRIDSKIEGIEDKIKVLAYAQTQGIKVPEENFDGLTQEKTQDIQKVFEKLDTDRKTRAEQVKKQAEADVYTQKADAVYARAEKIYEEDIDALSQIRQLLRSGDVDLAERRINKSESKSKSEPKIESKETEVKKVELSDEEKEKIAREYMVKKGLLKSDTGLPSGTGRTFQDIEADFIAGKPGAADEYEEAKQKYRKY